MSKLLGAGWQTLVLVVLSHATWAFGHNEEINGYGYEYDAPATPNLVVWIVVPLVITFVIIVVTYTIRYCMVKKALKTMSAQQLAAAEMRNRQINHIQLPPGTYPVQESSFSAQPYPQQGMAPPSNYYQQPQQTQQHHEMSQHQQYPPQYPQQYPPQYPQQYPQNPQNHEREVPISNPHPS